MYVSLFFKDNCTFIPISDFECPLNPSKYSECSMAMENDQFCEADKTLPDGNVHFDINNCDTYDVFVCAKGGKYFIYFSRLPKYL